MAENGDPLTRDQTRALMFALPIALAVGLGLTVGGAYLIRFHLTLAFHGAHAPGEVIELEPGSSTGSSGQAAFFPIVVFTTALGEEVTFRHRTGQRPPAYDVGDSVTVSYLPEEPGRALIAEGFMNWLLPGLLIVIGPVLSVLSARGLLRLRRRPGA